MINVEQVYQSMRDLSSKGKGGYADSDEFNKNSKRAELLLLQYYCSVFEKTGLVPDAIYPFLKEPAPVVLDSNGRIAIPSDMIHRVFVKYVTATNGPSGPILTEYQTQYLEKLEEMATLDSPIRKPNFENGIVAYAFGPNSTLQIYPKTLTGYVKIQYFRAPTYAVRGWTLDVTNDEQDYDAGTSTQYEWPPQEENNILDLIMLSQGITMRDSQIIQWASSHQSLTPNIPIV
jgi:hypothetical protein